MNGKVPEKTSLTFAVSVNNEEVFSKNALASPVFRIARHELLARRAFPSASVAFNRAIDEAKNDIIVFMHQDVYLPEGWDLRLLGEIRLLEREGIKWGVLGCYGVSAEGDSAGHVYSNGLKKELKGKKIRSRVQSLDELLLVIRKGGGLRFDPMMPHFHLYGTDICLSAAQRGLENFTIDCFSVHNSVSVRKLPSEFWACAEFIRRKWRERLPVKACCVTIYPEWSRMIFVRALSGLRELKVLTGSIEKPKRLDDPSFIWK